jgi:putative membrane protein
MRAESTIIQSAVFNPNIKSYMFVAGILLLFVSMIGILFLPIWLLGFGQFYVRHYYKNLKCNLTSKYLEFEKGAFFKVVKTIPLENIQDLTFIENPLLRLFDLRIIKVETAGQSNPNGTDMNLIGIVNASDFKNKVLDQREILQKENKSGNQDLETDKDKTNKLLTEIRDILIELKNK